MSDQPDPGVLLERLRERVEKGELDRAKELATQYPRLVYDPLLWRTCGELLLQTFDVEVAGRLLFFAGSEDAAHRDAIDLYLRRADFARLRADARRAGGLDALPPAVQRVLRDRGVKSVPPREARRRSSPSRLGCLVGALILLLCVGVVALGVWKAIELIAALFD